MSYDITNLLSDYWNDKIRALRHSYGIDRANMYEKRELPNDIFFNITDDYHNYHKRRSTLVSWIWPLIFLAAGIFIYFLVYVNDQALPRSITIDEIKLNPHDFSGENSRTISRKLQYLGPRIVGTPENEILAPEILRLEIESIIAGKHDSQLIEHDLQKGSGGYYLEYKRPFANIYDGIQNFIVKVHGSSPEHSILINCHFDTVEISPGGGDDAIACSTMVEMIRVLSHRSQRLKHSLVFLFNGAEETYLQAAHLFLAHDWAKNCRAVVNMDACGVGGRQVLFQSGPNHPWLFNYYAKVAPHPHGQVLGEEMFQNGVIPSDSDFRVFRDFGNMPGMDFAIWRNGYIYHTIYDSERYMTQSVHQYIGENILPLLIELGNAPEIEDTKQYEEGKMVYYDYLGWFMIYYTVTAHIVINSLAIVLGFASIVVFLVRPWKLGTLGELCLAILARIIGMGAGVGLSVGVAYIVDATATLVMPWYSEPWLIFPLYWCPCIVMYMLVPYLLDLWRKRSHKMSDARTTQMHLIAAQIPWLVILLVLTAMGIRSSSLLFLPVLSSSVANLLINATPLKDTKVAWIWTYLLLHIPSMLYMMYAVLLCYMFFIPIFGRSGPENNEVVIAILSTVFLFLIINFAAPLMTYVKKSGITLAVLAIFSFIMIIIALTTNLGHPYKIRREDPRPQRLYIMHTLRELRDDDGAVTQQSGYFIYNYDKNSPRTLHEIFGTSEFKDMDQFCKEELYCGLPLFGSPMIGMSPTSHWVDAGEPEFPKETEISSFERTYSGDNCTLKLTLNGPDRMTLTFSPRRGAVLLDWDLPSEVGPTGIVNGNRAFFVNIVRTYDSMPYPVTLVFRVTTEQIAGAKIADIGLAGNYVHHDEHRTQEYKDFLDKIKGDTSVDPWISAYKGYKL